MATAETSFDLLFGTKNDLAVIYLPDPPEGQSYSLFDGFVKSPQTVALSDLTDENAIDLVASYKVFPKKE